MSLVSYARKKGLKAAARCYECSRNTVRKWVRRFALMHNQGLSPVSRAPHSCPHKTSPVLEAKCIAKRKQTPGFGSRRLIAEFDLKIGHNALDRILRQRQLTRKPKRRHKRKNDLRAVKAAYAPFTRFQMDVKYLTDIPFYWPQMQANGLPRFQYTIRELLAGAQFLAYSNELSKTYATFAVDRFLQHLKTTGSTPPASSSPPTRDASLTATPPISSPPASMEPSNKSFKPNTASIPRPAPTPTRTLKVFTTPSKRNCSMPRSFLPKPISSPKLPPTNSGITPRARTVLAAIKAQPICLPSKLHTFHPKSLAPPHPSGVSSPTQGGSRCTKAARIP